MLLYLTLLGLFSFDGTDAATCDTITSFSNTWPNGQDGTLNLIVPVTTSSWTIVMTFDKPITVLSPWQGVLSAGGCVGGTVCTFTNQNYNGVQNQGASLSLGYQTQFATTSVPPKLISLTFNGASICSNVNVATTTAATTTTSAKTTTTTAKTTTSTSGGTPICDAKFYAYDANQWTGGANGNFYVTFPTSVTSWRISVQFASAVNSLNAYTGTNSPCSGSVCTFTNASYNGVQSAGASLTLGFQVLFNGSPAPNIISISLNNVVRCSGSGGSTQAPPTTTTPASTTTTKASTTTAGSTTTTKPVSTTTAGPTTTTTAGPTTTTQVATGRCADYSKLINISMLFYEAQRSGKLPANQRVTWRKDSALNDKGNNGEDLTGGYYDAGDYVKFGFPMAYTITVLAWGGIAYPEGYTNSGQTSYLLDAVKWGTDYFIKCHVSPNVFYGQVGDGNADHSYWGRPEDMTMARPAWAITTSAPGSELAGETAAAMAAASILFKTANPAYSATLLTHAQQLFTFADTYRGNYAQSISNAANFYNSYSGYNDELVWAALWLHKATGTSSYLTYATAGYSSFGFSGNTDVLSWDSKAAGIKVLIAQLTGQASYIQDVANLCNSHMSAPKSPKGEAFFSQWGSLRYAANAAYICLLASDLNVPAAQKTSFQAFAVAQMEYILTSTGRSFVIGFGNNYPTRPHHRSSSCPDAPATCDWNNYNSPNPNPHLLYGALVGGPAAANDQYTDVRSDYVSNEVAMDYNAGFQSLLAGLKKKACP